MRFKLKIGNYFLRHNSSTRFYRLLPDLIGMQSRTRDNKHIVFLDFDKSQVKPMIRKCNEIQERHSLGNFYLFRSSKGNFHAICFDKLSFGKVVDIQMELGMKRYIMASVDRGYWNMRISPKSEPIRYIGCIKGNPIWFASRAHFSFLAKMHDEMQHEKPDNLDGSSGLKLDIYTSVRK